MAPDTEKLTVQLKKILESDQFSRSNVNVALLSLLFRATIDGRKLKEATIGAEIFGKNYDPVKNDNKVRVYVHNLRKKLVAYYENEGKSDEFIFQIEKGEYRITFKTTETEKYLSTKPKILFGAFLLLLFLIVLSLFIRKEHACNFWEGFLNKKFPTTLLIGDHFTIESKVPTGGLGVFRDFAINSAQDYAEHIRQHADQASQMVPNRYPYITKMGPYCTQMLSQFFFEQDLPFELLLNSEWDKSKINTDNVVYVGQFKTMGFLQNVFTGNFTNYQISGNLIERTSENGEKDRYSSATGNEIVDYTIVAKMHGSAENDVAMFVSDNDIGVIRLVEYFTNADSLDAFYDRHQLSDKDFSALYKVSGWERTGYAMELIALDVK